MVWFYRAKTMREQAEDKPKPVTYYFEPKIAEHFQDVKQSEVTNYFEVDLVHKLQANKDIDGNK